MPFAVFCKYTHTQTHAYKVIKARELKIMEKETFAFSPKKLRVKFLIRCVGEAQMKLDKGEREESGKCGAKRSENQLESLPINRVPKRHSKIWRTLDEIWIDMNFSPPPSLNNFFALLFRVWAAECWSNRCRRCTTLMVRTRNRTKWPLRVTLSNL